jgi:hypothetical protein
MQSSIHRFIPFVKLHHTVLLSDKPNHHVYTLDFTPINQTQTSTLLKLFIGQNVPGEIRLRYIETSIENTKVILEKWDNINKVNEYVSEKHSETVYNKIYNSEIRNIINNTFEWTPYMNLYNHNCRHFSNFVKKIHASNMV